MRLSKQQLNLLNYLANGGTAKIVYIPVVMIGNGDQVINWQDYEKLEQSALLVEQDHAVVLTEQGRTIQQEREQCAKTVEAMKSFRQLELV